MKTQDELVQEQIEKGNHDNHDVDHRAYQIVFNGVRKKPAITLSSGFTTSVLRRIQQLKEERSLRKDFIWLGIGLFAFLIAAIITIIITGFKFNFGALRFLSSYGGLFIFGALFILGLQWIDKKLVIHNPN